MEQDESQDIIVAQPIEKLIKAKAVISNWEFDISADNPHDLRFYFCANEIYIQNLIKGRESPVISEEQRKSIPNGTIIVQHFSCEIKEPRGKDQETIQCEGDIYLIFQQYKGLRVCLKINKPSFRDNDYLAARFLLSQGQGNDPNFKTKKLSQIQSLWSCLIEESELQKFCRNRLAIEFIIIKQTVFESKFSGIKNDGNTCYMNSILQVLHFIRILRQNVVNYEKDGKVIKALRQVMLSLMDGPASNSGPADAQELIRAYGRFADYPRRQQDTQQFLLGFLEELEEENPTLAQLWQGQSLQILQSTEQDKPYRSTVKQDFSGLDLQLEDEKGNTFATLLQAIQHLLHKQKVEDKIQTDEYGKTAVCKSKQFIRLPPVLFITLKRYKYKRGSNRPVKVLADLEYPEKIDLGFLLGTPTGEDMNYMLYAVTVHKGQSYSSGHYYSFVNTSQYQNDPYWVRFDDSRVTLASTKQALSFSGGKRKVIEWDKDYEKFRQKQHILEDTAYVLVYVKIESFRQFQKIDVEIPINWIIDRRKEIVREQIRQETDLMEVEVYVWNFEPNFDPFGSFQTFPIPLRPKEDIVTQLNNKKNMDLLSCRVGTIWKVFKPQGKIKQLHQYADISQTPLSVFGYKKGHKIPTYLLVLPASIPIYQKIQSVISIRKYGLIKEVIVGQDGQTLFEWKLIDKNSLEEFVNEQQKKYEKKGGVQNKDLFVYDWNDFCSVVLD